MFYLVTFLYFNKSTFNLNKNNSEYFLNHSFKINGKQNLDNYFYLFIALIIIEFLSFNFRSALIVDTFHDSVFLTPPTNYLVNEGFFSSTLYDYGFTGNNLGLFFNYFFGFYTLGSINFMKLLLILFIKLLLILISKKLIEYIDYENFYKKIFFILFTFIIISLPNYYDLSSHFSPRSALYLLVILLISSSLCEKKKTRFKVLYIRNLFFNFFVMVV